MSSIGSVGSVGSSNGNWMMQGMRQRPDAGKMAENLFSKLDTSGQGFIRKSDLQTAFDSISSSRSTSSATSVDDLFSTLDTDSDGKVSRQEFTDTLTQLQNDLEQQFQDSRMQMAMQAGGMGRGDEMGGRPPPPPPPEGEGPSMTKDDLTNALGEIGTSDPRSEMMSNILNNFEAADTNSDGEVSFQEAMAYQQSSSTSTSESSASAASSSSSGSTSEARVMMQIMKLMQAYGIGNDRNQTSGLLSSLSVSA